MSPGNPPEPNTDSTAQVPMVVTTAASVDSVEAREVTAEEVARSTLQNAKQILADGAATNGSTRTSLRDPEADELKPSNAEGDGGQGPDDKSNISDVGSRREYTIGDEGCLSNNPSEQAVVAYFVEADNEEEHASNFSASYAPEHADVVASRTQINGESDDTEHSIEQGSDTAININNMMRPSASRLLDDSQRDGNSGLKTCYEASDMNLELSNGGESGDTRTFVSAEIKDMNTTRTDTNGEGQKQDSTTRGGDAAHDDGDIKRSSRATENAGLLVHDIVDRSMSEVSVPDDIDHVHKSLETTQAPSQPAAAEQLQNPGRRSEVASDPGGDANATSHRTPAYRRVSAGPGSHCNYLACTIM